MATLPAPRLTVVIALALATLSFAAKEVTISPANDLELHARSLQASTCAGYSKKRKCKRGGASPPPPFPAHRRRSRPGVPRYTDTYSPPQPAAPAGCRWKKRKGCEVKPMKCKKLNRPTIARLTTSASGR